MSTTMIVETLPMVTARSKKIVPMPESIADTASSHLVIAASGSLRSCHYRELRQVECTLQSGDLILQGQVSTFHLKQLAQETVRSVAREMRIVNRLEVVYASPSNESIETQ